MISMTALFELFHSPSSFLLTCGVSHKTAVSFDCKVRKAYQRRRSMKVMKRKIWRRTATIPDRDVSSLVTLYKNVWSHSSFAAIMLHS